MLSAVLNLETRQSAKAVSVQVMQSLCTRRRETSVAFVSLFSQVVTQASPATLRGRQEILEPLQVVSIIDCSLVRLKSTVEMLLSSRGMTVCGQSRVSHHCISAHVPPIKCFVQIIADVRIGRNPVKSKTTIASVVH